MTKFGCMLMTIFAIHGLQGAALASGANTVVYASDIGSSAMHGTWSKATDATSPNQTKLVTPDNGWPTIDAPLDFSKPGAIPARQSYILRPDASAAGGQTQVQDLFAAPLATSYKR